MPSPSADLIPITQAAKEYPTSRRTIERKRQKARKTGDDETLNAFVIRTKDDHEYPAPTQELARELAKDGRQPETFIRRDWLDKHFRHDVRQDDSPSRRDGGTKRQPSPSDGGGVTQPDATHQEKITAALLTQLVRKDEQLQTQSKLIEALTERQRESNILIGQFQKLLPQPKQQKETLVVDTTPRIEPVKEKPRSASSKKKPTKTPATKQRGWFSKLISGKK